MVIGSGMEFTEHDSYQVEILATLGTEIAEHDSACDTGHTTSDDY